MCSAASSSGSGSSASQAPKRHVPMTTSAAQTFTGWLVIPGNYDPHHLRNIKSKSKSHQQICCEQHISHIRGPRVQTIRFNIYSNFTFIPTDSATLGGAPLKATMKRFWPSAVIAGLWTASLVSAEAYTPKHEAGRCAIRGTCGKQSLFSPELPCPDNDLAKEPEDDVRKQLVGICGPKWNTGPICCESEQVIYSTIE